MFSRLYSYNDDEKFRSFGQTPFDLRRFCERSRRPAPPNLCPKRQATNHRPSSHRESQSLRYVLKHPSARSMTMSHVTHTVFGGNNHGGAEQLEPLSVELQPRYTAAVVTFPQLKLPRFYDRCLIDCCDCRPSPVKRLKRCNACSER